MDKRALFWKMREAGGLAAVARRMGVSRQTIYNWIDAERIPERHVAALLRETGLTRREAGVGR